MARIVADRVLETSTTTGTGSYTLAGAVLGYRAASAVCANGDTITYYAEATNVNGVANGDWEIGIGTWGTGNILARTTVVASSNSNAAVSWTTGTRRIGLGIISTPSLGNTTLTGYVDATPIAAPAWTEGRVFYDVDAHTLNYYNDNIQMSINIGQEQIVRVRNTTGSTIPDGAVVYVSDAVGQTPVVTLAIATSLATAKILGVTTTTMLDNEFGYVTVNGTVNGLNTVAFADGAVVYLSAVTAGTYSTVSPDYPNYSVQVGIVLHSHTTQGKLLVSPQLSSTEASHVVGTLAIAQGGTGQTTALAGFNALSPLTTEGDLVVGGALGSGTRLPIGGATTVLHGGATPTYSAITEDDINLSANATNNVNTTRHGFVPVLPNNANLFLNGQGNYTTPSGLSIANSYSVTAFSGQTSINIVHNFGTFPIVQVVDNTGAVLVPLTITNNTINDFTVTFSTATTGTIMSSVGSPQPQAVSVIASSTYTVLITDRIVKVTTASAVITLPTSVGNTGREYNIVNASTGKITVIGTSSQLINNQTTQTLPPSSAMTVFADGSGYWII